MDESVGAIVVQKSVVAETLGKALLAGKLHDVCFTKKDGTPRWMRCRVNLDELTKARLGKDVNITEAKHKMVAESELRDLVLKGRISLEEVLSDGTQIRSFKFNTVTEWTDVEAGEVYVVGNLPVGDENRE